MPACLCVCVCEIRAADERYEKAVTGVSLTSVGRMPLSSVLSERKAGALLVRCALCALCVRDFSNVCDILSEEC